jgi:D-alanyl-D-alanine carboxypeptidase
VKAFLSKRADDPVGEYVPNLTRGGAITIRQILSHTSGYP